MRLRVNPTRMELLRLRRRYDLAVRGHRLLKQKLDGLLKSFRPLVDQYREKRRRLDTGLPTVLQRFLLARAVSSGATIEAALAACVTEMDLDSTQESVMNTPIPRLRVRSLSLQPNHSLAETPAEFDRSLAGLKEVLPLILEVAALEEAVRRLAHEIERTRRRVNALEYVVIPNLAQAQNAIQSKLDELDRSFRVQIMKVKEMIAEAQ